MKGVKIGPPENLEGLGLDLLIISSTVYYDEIYMELKYLEAYGIEIEGVADADLLLAALEKMFDGYVYKECCVRNYDGVIYKCGFQMTWRDLGLMDDIKVLQKDGIDLNDRTDDRTLKKRLKEYVRSTVPFEICKYCKGNATLFPRVIQL